MGGKEYAIWSCSAQQRLKIHMRQVISITCPNIRVQTFSESPHMVVVPMQNPIVHSHHQHYWAPPSWMSWCPKSCMDHHPKMRENGENS